MRTLVSPKTKEADNLKGWESVAAKWKDVRWPRRPSFKGEFDKTAPLLSTLKGEETLVLGATPEFRSWLGRAGSRISVYEKSGMSYAAMSSIMRTQLHSTPANENVIPSDWESPDYERGRYKVVMGDIVSGYLETKERFGLFLRKVHEMLAPGGTFLLREFVREPCLRLPASIDNPDLRRWAFILTAGFAVENGVFFEEKLALNLAKIRDYDALATCADPPRTRLMPSFKEYSASFAAAGFDAELVSPPDVYGPKPALWALRRDN